jgi:hypothetical protein
MASTCECSQLLSRPRIFQRSTHVPRVSVALELVSDHEAPALSPLVIYPIRCPAHAAAAALADTNDAVPIPHAALVLCDSEILIPQPLLSEGNPFLVFFAPLPFHVLALRPVTLEDA